MVYKIELNILVDDFNKVRQLKDRLMDLVDEHPSYVIQKHGCILQYEDGYKEKFKKICERREKGE